MNTPATQDRPIYEQPVEIALQQVLQMIGYCPMPAKTADRVADVLAATETLLEKKAQLKKKYQK